MHGYNTRLVTYSEEYGYLLRRDAVVVVNGYNMVYLYWSPSTSSDYHPYNNPFLSGTASPRTRFHPPVISWFSLPNSTADVKQMNCQSRRAYPSKSQTSGRLETIRFCMIVPVCLCSAFRLYQLQLVWSLNFEITLVLWVGQRLIAIYAKCKQENHCAFKCPNFAVEAGKYWHESVKTNQ